MRLLSFLTLVEQHLLTTRPELSSGWQRRVNYQSGTAALAHPGSGLTLLLRSTTLASGTVNLHAGWHGVTGSQIHGSTFFSGGDRFSWDDSAKEVASHVPAPALTSPVETVPAPAAVSIPA